MIEKSDLKVGDMVNFHSLIGGPVTSTGHKIMAIEYAPNNFGCDVAWITNKSGCVAVRALSHKRWVNLTCECPECKETRGMVTAEALRPLVERNEDLKEELHLEMTLGHECESCDETEAENKRLKISIEFMEWRLAELRNTKKVAAEENRILQKENTKLKLEVESKHNEIAKLRGALDFEKQTTANLKTEVLSDNQIENLAQKIAVGLNLDPNMCIRGPHIHGRIDGIIETIIRNKMKNND